MSTVGTSRYNLLSWDEMRDINRTVASSVKPGTQSIVTSPTTGGLRHMIEFGKHAEEIGADYWFTSPSATTARRTPITISKRSVITVHPHLDS